MKTLMDRRRVRTLGLVAAGCVVALPVFAAEAGDDRGQGSVQSDAGVVAGLAVGALAGGPVGAVVGAGVGAFIGDRYHRQLQSKKALAQDLTKSEAERAQLTVNVAQLDHSLSQERSHNADLDATLQRTDQIGVDVGFRTNDDAVTTQSMPPLLKLGGLVASMPQARVRIAGYADPRGSDTLNDALSLRRAQSVAAVLTSAGVPRERIVIEGHGKGESTSAEGDLDAYAFDRRVTVRMELPGSGEVASRD
jgi:outer membrane protein OmpA-like peptidoglycan-associated protein